MKNKCRIIVLLLLATAAPAQAATSCFDWSCANLTCTFNAACSSASPFVYKYLWDFGDGSGWGPTGNSSLSHTYSASGPANPVVSLTITYFSEPGATTTTCEITVRFVVGPQYPLNGRCSTTD